MNRCKKGRQNTKYVMNNAGLLAKVGRRIKIILYMIFNILFSATILMALIAADGFALR